ncbi:hemolysin III family protein [Roseospira marina]|uniref:Hemolysin III family protein n=1 Tax=Roseospira marina TaxID=140057 RepID=A0A5M6IFP4_9PROT|nr:hemolysin III family protein [Roseospira marina]KAA5606747.1 hemolysin III family protein [Roseospira marina]MBB4313833.1 hemolysin III [Roseospira marina]MBB5086995.1 hemolysin III [Roseospira marina]
MHPSYTPAERWLDGAVHVTGVVLAILAFVILLVRAIPTGDAQTISAVTVYGLGMLASFGMSAAYNITWAPHWKERLRRLDHAAIYLLIAGTYTPFALVNLSGWVGNALLAAIWPVALLGLVLKLIWPRRFERLSLVLYLALGWIGLSAVGAMIAALPVESLVLLLIGGLLYSGGVAFHLAKRLRFHNAIWHMCVLVAAVCHYVAVSEAVLPG